MERKARDVVNSGIEHLPWEHSLHPQYRELEREEEEETIQHKSHELETIGGGKTVIKSNAQQSRGDVAFLQRGGQTSHCTKLSHELKNKERPS